MLATPPTEVNITELTTKAIETIGKIYGSENIAPDYGQIPFFNDDFAYFQHHVPGVYFFLGGSNFEKGLISMPHSTDFAVDEESIRVGVMYFSSLIVERTKKLPFLSHTFYHRI
jgi:metal-dependent amidase/aminoacylase/carboxypeptidase family protein